MTPAWSDGNRSSRDSDASYFSKSTAPTSYHDELSRPSLKHYESKFSAIIDKERSPSSSSFDPKASTSTYASTIPSDEDLDDEEPEYEVPQHSEADYRYEAGFDAPDVVAATPPEFAELFPSTRRLQIHHDDSTIDGNMNLRVDAPVSAAHGRQQNITLFHLRMHDLKSRQFSLRRYCRDSGREVCHSHKVIKKAQPQRPVLQRSVSSVLSSIRGFKTEKKVESNLSGLRRNDSGYDSGDGEGDDVFASSSPTTAHKDAGHSTNITKLEFSNYAQVDVKRHGTSSSKRYNFEYWGTHYSWRRHLSKDGSDRQASYHLVNEKTGMPVAHITPNKLSHGEVDEELAKGGWIAPSTFWISDQSVIGGLADVADIIMSTGLIALVDDSIARRFHQKRAVQISVPLLSKTSPMKLNMEYVGPKKLIDEVFARRNSHGSTSSSAARHPTPLRQISAEA